MKTHKPAVFILSHHIIISPYLPLPQVFIKKNAKPLCFFKLDLAFYYTDANTRRILQNIELVGRFFPWNVPQRNEY